MKEFGIDDLDVLVKGGVINAFLDAFGAYRSRGESVMTRHLGLGDATIERESYYPCAKMLAGFRELQEQFGEGFMHRIGQSIYEQADFPEGLATFQDLLAAVDTAYYLNHQNGEGKLGHYAYTKTGESSGTMVCDVPYPCAFDMGIFVGAGRQFGVEVRVTHEDDEVCRRKGADQCTYLIEW